MHNIFHPSTNVYFLFYRKSSARLLAIAPAAAAVSSTRLVHIGPHALNRQTKCTKTSFYSHSFIKIITKTVQSDGDLLRIINYLTNVYYINIECFFREQWINFEFDQRI